MIKTSAIKNDATPGVKASTPELAIELQVAILATAIDQIKNKAITDVAKDTLKNIEGLKWSDIEYVLKMISDHVTKKKMGTPFNKGVKLLLPDLETKKLTKEQKKEAPKLIKSSQKTVKASPIADWFPDEYATPFGVGIVSRKSYTLETLKEEARTSKIIFAMYWNERHCAQSPYDPQGRVAQPYCFKDDLDIILLRFMGKIVAHGVSVATEMMYIFDHKDLKFHAKHGMRFCKGIDYQIYLAPKVDEKNKEYVSKVRKEVKGLVEIATTDGKEEVVEVVKTPEAEKVEIAPEVVTKPITKKELPIEDARKPSKAALAKEQARLEAEKAKEKKPAAKKTLKGKKK